MPARKGLTANQRLLYLYFLNHRKKHGKAPCFVPRIPQQTSRQPDYITAIQRLEEKGFIRVDRRTRHYTGWIMLDPAPNSAPDSAPACAPAGNPV